MLKRDVTVLLAGNVVAAGLAFLANVVTARWLGPEGRGVMNLGLFLPTVISTFGMLGQDSINCSFAGLYKEARGQLFAQTLLFTVFGTLLGVAVISGFFALPIPKGNFGSLTPSMRVASMAVVPVLVFNSLLLSLVRGMGFAVLTSILRIASNGGILVLVVLWVVWFKQGITGALWGTALGPLPASLVAAWFVRRQVHWDPHTSFWWLLRKSLTVGVPVSFAVFAAFLVYRLDQGVLGYVVSKRELGLYAVAVSLAEAIKLLPYAINMAFLPVLSNDIANRQGQVPAVFRASLIVSIMGMVGAAGAGVLMILTLYGRAFAGSIGPLLILLPGVAALCGAGVLASDLLAREKTGYNVRVSYLTLVVSAILNLSLVPLIGIYGAAITGTVSYMVSLWLWIAYYRRESGRSLHELMPRRADVDIVWQSMMEMAGRMLRVAAWRGRPAAAEENASAGMIPARGGGSVEQ